MSKRYSGKSFKDSSVMKNFFLGFKDLKNSVSSKLSLKEKRKIKKRKKKNKN